MIKKVINTTIYFYDENNFEIMHIDHSTDECIWYFYSDEVIYVTPNMELYNVLSQFMKNMYKFDESILSNYKDLNKLRWHSDCYYNPDDEWSIASVSCLNIERNEEGYKIWCTKKIDEMINKTNRTYGICFSPAGNGQYSKNLNTGLTLQDDFVSYIYQPLLIENKQNIKKLFLN